jgi:hypothetical protein
MADVTRFAGYASPLALSSDPALTRADKLSALKSWQGQVLGRAALGDGERAQLAWLIDEIGRALAELEAGVVRRRSADRGETRSRRPGPRA